MDKKQILEKIKKCLALSKSANEHEAAAALAKARELMDEYNVTEADVLTADVNEARSAPRKGETLPNYLATLGYLVGRAFNCRVIYSGEVNWTKYEGQRFIRFIGLGISPELAQYAYAVLSRQLINQRSEYIKTKLKRCKTSNKTRRADIYCEGWVASVRGIVVKFAKYEPAPAIKTYIDTNNPQLTERKSNSRMNNTLSDRDRVDYFNGAMAGKDAKLNHGLAGENLKELGS